MVFDDFFLSKKNRETRHETKKKWGDETKDKKNGETRHETKKHGQMRRKNKKKWGDETLDEKKWGD